MTDFFSANNVNHTALFTVAAGAGTTVTTPQCTKIEIPEMAFWDSAGAPITGTYTVEFKDVYKKSDMFFAQMPTAVLPDGGYPLKSGGEFMIHVTSGNSTVFLAPGKKITVTLPALLTGGVDPLNPQQAFIWKDTAIGLYRDQVWGMPNPPSMDTVVTAIDKYVYSLYEFNPSGSGAGTWCNSDNRSYFDKYPLTTLAILADDSSTKYGTQVFLIFSKVNCMVHVYPSQVSTFPYEYAPTGLECTIVALGVKAGEVYSAFVPITISANQTVHFSMTKTTTAEFKASLKALD